MNRYAQTALLAEDPDPDLPIGRRAAIRRINRAMDYINAHLAEPLKLKQIAAQAQFSPFHFVRVFTAVTGETPAQHLRRLRLMRAAALLYAWRNAPILDVALATGFQSAAVFARAFRVEFGMSASAWRRADFWRPCGMFMCWRPQPCHECETPAEWYRDLAHSSALRAPPWQTARPATLGEIKIERVPLRRIAYVRGVGPLSRTSMAVWRRLGRWLAVRGGLREQDELFGQLLDGPYITAPRYYRYDAGLFVDETFRPDSYVNTRDVPGGWFVTADFAGRVVDEPFATRYLWWVWLRENGCIPSGVPHYLRLRGRDNPTLREPGADNVVRWTYYLPILPPKRTETVGGLQSLANQTAPP